MTVIVSNKCVDCATEYDDPKTNPSVVAYKIVGQVSDEYPMPLYKPICYKCFYVKEKAP